MNYLRKARRNIDRIDNTIIKLLKKRIKIAKKIGDYKKKFNLGITDRGREREILRRISKYAASFGLNTKSVQKIFSIIIKEGRRVQK